MHFQLFQAIDNQDHLSGDNSDNGQSITLPFTFYLL